MGKSPYTGPVHLYGVYCAVTQRYFRTVVEFTAASNGHIVKCSKLSNAPASFKVR